MPKKIPLTRGKFAIIDDADLEWLNQWKWRYQYGQWGGYATRRDSKDGYIYMHRFILGISGKMEGDHINGDGLDNRRCNLRPCTSSQNKMNRRKGEGYTSLYKGVSWCSWTGRWRADIRSNGKRINLGRYDDEIDAAKAYDREARKLFKEFAKPNNV